MSTQTQRPYSNRDCAQAIIDLTRTLPAQDPKFLEKLAAPIRKLIARPDFFDMGVKRKSNHTGDGSKWLYYDAETSIVVDYLPVGRKIPAHDHGVWEACVVAKGSLSHKKYLRTDDGSKEGYATLDVLEDRIMTPGDAVMLAPPTEIHSFYAAEENTYFITVMGGPYKKFRNYFDPDAKTVVVRAPQGG